MQQGEHPCAGDMEVVFRLADPGRCLVEVHDRAGTHLAAYFVNKASIKAPPPQSTISLSVAGLSGSGVPSDATVVSLVVSPPFG